MAHMRSAFQGGHDTAIKVNLIFSNVYKFLFPMLWFDFQLVKNLFP